MTKKLDPNAILALHADGRLVRNQWGGHDDRGREIACLLAALSPDVVKAKSVSACPADIMPAWLAYMTPWMDDRVTVAAWDGMIRRYANLAGRWHVLTDEDWRRLDYTARRIAVEDTLPRAGSAKPSVDTVLALLRRAEVGEAIDSKDWAEAAREAAWAAWAARKADAARAAWAACAACAARKAAAEAEAARTAAREAEAEACDRITAAILDAIEAKITEREM